MKLVSPYKNIKQYTRISIDAYHMNSDIRNNMKVLLKKKLEKKCNKNGYIDEIYRIIDYSDGYLIPENLNGSAIYNISYHCKICIPIENTIIIGQTRVINQELIVAINGPIMCFIPKENIDTNIWSNYNYINKNTNQKLTLGDFIKIKIIDKRINQNDSQIKIIGYLLDIPTQEEIDMYFGHDSINNEKKIININVSTVDNNDNNIENEML
jgi:DNA-directed RNA polymerase subunit E'/Rpb7